jgi:hypothetical protein
MERISVLHAGRVSLSAAMKNDPVLAEIRLVREAYAERFAGDAGRPSPPSKRRWPADGGWNAKAD